MNTNLSEKTFVTNPEGYGYYQYCSFGKHKGDTYYDIANKGDFKYLEWCEKALTGEKWKINNSCEPHIKAALMNKNRGGVWMKHHEKFPGQRTGELWYEVIFDHELQEDEKSIEGPKIMTQECFGCHHYKNQKMFGNPFVCDTCVKKESQIKLIPEQTEDEQEQIIKDLQEALRYKTSQKKYSNTQ